MGSKYFNSIANLEDLNIRLSKGRVHQCEEALVIFYAPYRVEHYEAIPILVVGSCKAVTAVMECEIVLTVLLCWRDLRHDCKV